MFKEHLCKLYIFNISALNLMSWLIDWFCYATITSDKWQRVKYGKYVYTFLRKKITQGESHKKNLGFQVIEIFQYDLYFFPDIFKSKSAALIWAWLYIILIGMYSLHKMCKIRKLSWMLKSFWNILKFIRNIKNKNKMRRIINIFYKLAMQK